MNLVRCFCVSQLDAFCKHRDRNPIEVCPPGGGNPSLTHGPIGNCQNRFLPGFIDQLSKGGTVERLVRSLARHFENRGDNVHEAGPALGPHVCVGATGIAYPQWDPDHRFIHAETMVHHALLSEGLSMVAGNHEQSVLPTPMPAKTLHNSFEAMVDAAD